MNAERFARVKEVAGDLLEAGAETRAARLARLDADLRHDVESLLAAHDAATAFLARPAFETMSLEPEAPAERNFGPYRVVREIGAGGMGMVYEAERDDEIRKRVAIKVVRPGMDTAAILKRFDSERRIGAALNHPNIVTLIDGGSTPGGQPWFAMEFVEGSRIDHYCAGRSLRQRLELFRLVCGAVHHAHQNLVIHRDLKPSNILVTPEGVPKLLDFGIAKLLSPFPEDAALTMMALAMTPEYASPEQASGGVSTTATDLYSLGAVLYELLSGQRPHRFSTLTPQAIQQVIREQEPVAPSEASGLEELRGDLDNIVLKAMQKDPARRYSSAEELSQDLQRYLSGLPVLARPDTMRYRLGKFVRRHRTGAVAAALIALALTGGIVATMLQARIAARERDRADRRFAEVRKLAHAVVWDLSSHLPNLAGNSEFRAEMLDTGIRYLDGLAREAGQDPSLHLELAKGYDRTAAALRATGARISSREGSAADNYEKAVRFAQLVPASAPEWDEAQNVLISAGSGLALMRKDRPGLQRALARARARYEQNKASVERAALLATVESTAADQPVAGFRRALAVAHGVYQANPADPSAQRLYFTWAARNTVTLLFLAPRQAWMAYESAAPVGRGVVAARPEDHAMAYMHANALSAAGLSRSHAGTDLGRAREQLLESAAVFSKAIPRDPTDYDYRAYSAMARMGLADVEIRSGHAAPAIQAALEGLEIMKPFAEARLNTPSYRQAMGGLHVHAARAYQLGRQMARACFHYRESDRFYGPLTGPLPPFYAAMADFVAQGKAACRL